MTKGKKLNKKELIEVLVNEYGYEKSDLKKEDGKPFTNPELESMIKQEEEDAERFEKESQEEYHVVAKPQQFKDDDLIVVMNGLRGTLVHRSETSGRIWRFTDFGQIEKIPYGELLRIRNRSSKVFNQGWMIVLNKAIQEEFGLTELYKNIITPETIDDVFKKDVEELEKFIDAMPEGTKTAFIGKAKELYDSKKLDSMAKIDLIQNKFGFSLQDNAPLSDVAVKSKDS